MTYLLDVSTLIALIRSDHIHHRLARTWAKGKILAACPISELGFLRISTGPAFNVSMDDARASLKNFLRDGNPLCTTIFVPCDQSALDGQVATTSGKTTDWYLANLAQKHGMRSATLDAGAKHPAAELVS